MKTPCGRETAGSGTVLTQSRLAELQKRLSDYLAKQGLKYSEQRWKIAELILATSGHLDAQGIVEKVKQQHPEIGAATVYRNIKVLCEAAILKESLLDSQNRVVYELADDEHHDHIVCVDCGGIFEFHSDKIERLQTGIVDDMEFKQVRHRHIVYAKCNLIGSGALLNPDLS